MEDLRIIYRNADGGVSVVIPAVCGLTIEEIAEKDVPVGAPYKIVKASEIPSDRSARGEWAFDASNGVEVSG